MKQTSFKNLVQQRLALVDTLKIVEAFYLFAPQSECELGGIAGHTAHVEVEAKLLAENC